MPLERLGILIIIILFFSISACSKKAPSHSSVTIQFDQSTFSSKASTLANSVDGKTNNNHEPDWGLVDPSTLEDIDCFAVFVHANEAGLDTNSCATEAGSRFRFGPRAGLFSINRPGSIEIPSGNNRTIYLLGFGSKNGFCRPDFDINPDINAANHSAPFILGKVTANLVKPIEVVKINLSNQFTVNNKVKDCDFIDNKGFDLIGYDSHRKNWLANNPIPRTLKIEHEGISAKCSRNAGLSFNDCPTIDRFIWKVEDYENQHIVEVEMPDGKKLRKSFTPSEVYPNLNFIDGDCDHHITSSGDFNSVRATLITSDKLVCVLGHVKLNGFISSKTTLGKNLILISPQNPNHRKPTIEVTGFIFPNNLLSFSPTSSGTPSSLKIIGFEIKGDNFQGPLIKVDNQTSSDDYNIVFDDIEVHATKSNEALLFTMTGSGLTYAKINHSKFINTDSIYPAVNLASPNIAIEVDSSYFDGEATAFENHHSQAIFKNSELFGRALNSDAPAVEVHYEAHTEFIGSKVKTQGSSTLFANCHNDSRNLYLNFENSRFIRQPDDRWSIGPAIEIEAPSNSCTIEIDSENNNNQFCSVEPTVASFAAILVGPQENGSFTPTTYSIETCPQ